MPRTGIHYSRTLGLFFVFGTSGLKMLVPNRMPLLHEMYSLHNRTEGMQRKISDLEELLSKRNTDNCDAKDNAKTVVN